MTFPINAPFQYFTDGAGAGLEAGFIWIGAANQDPQSVPVAVYWDSALTIPAAQPIRTLGGFPARNGTPANIYTAGACSIRVQDRNGVTLYTAPSISSLSDLLAGGGGAALIGYGDRTVADKFQDRLSVKDFGAKGDRTPTFVGTDDTAAFIDAITAALAQGKALEIPPGNYRIASSIGSITLPATAAIRRDGTTLGILGSGSASTVITYEGAGDLFDIRIQDNFTPFTIHGLRLQRPQAAFSFNAIPAGTAIKLTGLYGFIVSDVKATYFDTAFEVAGSLVGSFQSCQASWCKIGYDMSPSGGINPNQITLLDSGCAFVRDFGLRNVGGVGLVFAGACTFEGGGDSANAVKGTPIRLQDMGADGGVACTVSGALYLEANYGDNQIYIAHTLEASYAFGGAMFNRVGPSDPIINDIVFDANTLTAGGPKATLDIRGAHFNSLAGNVRSALKKRLQLGLNFGNVYDGLTILSAGAMGLDDVDGPIALPQTVWHISPLRGDMAWCRFDGGTAALDKANNIYFVQRNGTGDCTFFFQRPIGGTVGMSFGALNSNCVAKIIDEILVGGLVGGVRIITHVNGTPTDSVGVITFTGDRL